MHDNVSHYAIGPTLTLMPVVAPRIPRVIAPQPIL